MECQKIINMLDNTPSQPPKFRTRNLDEINDDSRGTYNTNTQIIIKTSMLKSSLWDYSDAYILVKRVISVANAAAAGTAANNNDIEVILKNYPPFTDYISEINNTQIDNTKDVDLINWCSR